MEPHIAANLIRKGIANTSFVQWADLGAGTGVFTNALASILSEGSKIYAIDTNSQSLDRLVMTTDVAIEKIQGDFSQKHVVPLNLDGILLANSLHYIKDQRPFLRQLIDKLNEAGRLIIVEYELERSNLWVPYPINFKTLSDLADSLDLRRPEKIGQVPSRLNGSVIYSAVILK